MKIKHILFFSFLLIFFTSLQVTAEIRYVSHTGSNTYPYTSWETAADSIQKAINASNHGDTIIVANGIYKETLVIDKQLTLLGSSMDSTIIDGRGLSGVNYPRMTIEIKGNLGSASIINFTIYGKSTTTASVNITSYNSSLIVENCKLLHSYETGIDIDRGNLIANNLLFKDVGSGFTVSGFSTNLFQINSTIIISNRSSHTIISNKGIIALGGGTLIAENNIIISENLRGYYGIDLSQPHNAIIKNNLIAGYNRHNIYDSKLVKTEIVNNVIILNDTLHQFSDKESIYIYNGTNTSVKNNVIGYSRKGLHSLFNSPESDYNLYWKNRYHISGGAQFGENDIIADPMFVKDTIPWLPAADYHLQAFSPAIDAGDPDILDVDGSRSDIGMYGGPGGTSYHYLDLAPRTPRNFTLTYDSLYTAVHFKWNMNTERDFSHYNIYRDTVSGFSISETNKVFETDTSVYSEIIPSMQEIRYYYRITAIDSQMNESQPGEELSVIISSSKEPELEVINKYRLYQNYPNPFNPSTRISYNLKERGYVKMMLYDLKGSIIDVLINENKEAGYYEYELDVSKYSLASGIYLYRIEVIGEGNIPRFADMKKMLIIK